MKVYLTDSLGFNMNFEKFIRTLNEADQDTIRLFIEGFPERQRKREEEFARKAKMMEPHDGWYERRYNI